MRTRSINLMLIATLFAVCLSAEAQQSSRVWRLGLFHVGLDHVPPSFPALRGAVKELGYEEGKNIHFDWRNLPDDEAALATAKEFARQPVDLIVAFEDQTIRAAKTANVKVPVLFLHANAPVVDGFVESFARPGGNMTGFVAWPVSNGKQVELFKEMIPDLGTLLLLVHPDDPVGSRWRQEMRRAGAALKVRLIEREATNQAEIERVMRSVRRDEVGGVAIASLILRNSYSSVIVNLAAGRRLPLVCIAKNGSSEARYFPMRRISPQSAELPRPMSIRF